MTLGIHDITYYDKAPDRSGEMNNFRTRKRANDGGEHGEMRGRGGGGVELQL